MTRKLDVRLLAETNQLWVDKVKRGKLQKICTIE
ncbi:hypothetical protein IID10_08525 [candidate division KSB1 bacterium]|nr:hypothetical protein [candidate division KSB1 bacterium]